MIVQSERIIAHQNDLEISFYDNDVPKFASHEIDRIYEHLGCSLLNLNMMKKSKGASTYVVRRGGVFTTILLYRVCRYHLAVLSDFAELTQDEIELFAKTAFARFSAVLFISFEAINATIEGLKLLHQSFVCGEDILINLPESVDEYNARLGRKTRYEIKRRRAELGTDFPSYECRVYTREAIHEDDIRAIIALNRKRMEGKNGISRIDEEETQWILNLARRCGLVLVARINGKVCGGWIGFTIGKQCFGHVIAHDPLYNQYSMGIIIVYCAVCESIRHGMVRFNMMSGRNQYKYQLLGVNCDIIHLDVYRNMFCALMCAGRISRLHAKKRVSQGKQWIMNAERRNDPLSRSVATALRLLRTTKRSGINKTSHAFLHSLKKRLS